MWLHTRLLYHTPSSQGSGISSREEQKDSNWMSAAKQYFLGMKIHLYTCNHSRRCMDLQKRQTRQNPRVDEGGVREGPPLPEELLGEMVSFGDAGPESLAMS